MFFLLTQTDDDILADLDRAAAAAARQKMLDRQAAPLTGRPVDTQGALFPADATLFTGPSAADILAAPTAESKPAARAAQPPAEFVWISPTPAA